ncbi:MULTISPECIES: hypothetical protein [Dietzia]|uniref:hypothetical protein n=2 Tax=Dietziaceae TaxID=85029 RepID=UPI0008051AB3|nr:MULTISPECIES: hypothetical protein [unclassified Dietzia]OAV79104.1 hypothetical protein AYO52_09525 [Dietzia sp. 111N12-1]
MSMQSRDGEDAVRLATLRAAVELGWADVAAGRYVDVGDSDLDDATAYIRARAVADGRSPG